MKNIKLIVLFISLFSGAVAGQDEDFRKQAPKPGPAPKIELGEYEQFQLDNGLTVIVVENHKLPKVSFQLLVDLPLIFEGETAGAAAMAGELLSTGTTSRTKQDIDEAVDFIGASFSTGAGGIYGSCLTKHQEELLEIMSDVLLHPSFPQEEFDKLKTQTLSGLAVSKDDPDAIAGRVAQVLRFGKDHPYGELTTETTVEHITLEGCRKFYDSFFRPNISYLAIVGDISPQQARGLVERFFGSWTKGEVPVKKYGLPQAPEKNQVSFVDKAGAVQSVINITYPVELKPGDPDAISAGLMNLILGYGSYSRLYKNIREDKGYTYGAYSSLSPDKEVGYFSAEASVRNEVTDSAIVEFFKEMERIRDEKVPSEELRFAQNFRTGYFAIQLESPQTIARYALNISRFGLPKDYYATYLEKLNALTPEDIQAAARKYIKPENAQVLVVGNKDEVAGKLVRFDSDGQVAFRDIYGNPVEESAVELPAGLRAEDVVESYIKTIGSREKLSGVTDVTMEMGSEIQGMQMVMIRRQKSPDKLSMTVSVNGMPMSQQRFDGERAMLVAQGQKQTIDEEMLKEMKAQAALFPEMGYRETGYRLELKGIEKINEEEAYHVIVTRPDGKKINEYYDTDTFLKMRVVQTQGGPGGTQTITSDLSDYKEVGGILWPHALSITGLAPFPLNMEVSSIEVNKGIDDAEFAVED